MKAVKCAAGFALAGSLLAVCPALAFANDVQMRGESVDAPPQGYVPDPEPQIDTEPPLPMEPPHIGGAISAISEETIDIDDRTTLTKVSQAGSFDSLTEAEAFIQSGESKYEEDKQAKPESEFSDFNKTITERSFETDLGHWPYDAEKAFFNTEEEARIAMASLALYGYMPEDCIIERHLVGETQKTHTMAFDDMSDATSFFEQVDIPLKIEEPTGDINRLIVPDKSVKHYEWRNFQSGPDYLPDSEGLEYVIFVSRYDWTYWSPFKNSLNEDLLEQLEKQIPSLAKLDYTEPKIHDYESLLAIIYDPLYGDDVTYAIGLTKDNDYVLNSRRSYILTDVYYGKFDKEFDTLYKVAYGEMIPQYQYSLEGNMRRMVTMYEANYDYSYTTSFPVPPSVIEVLPMEDVGGNPRKIVDDDVPVNSPEAYALEPEMDQGEPVIAADMGEKSSESTDGVANPSSEYAKAEVIDSSNSQLTPATIDSVPTRMLALLVGIVSVLLTLISPKRKINF